MWSLLHSKEGIPCNHKEPWRCAPCRDTTTTLPVSSCRSCALRKHVYHHPPATSPDDLVPGRCSGADPLTLEWCTGCRLYHREPACQQFANTWCYTRNRAYCNGCHTRMYCYCELKIFNWKWLPVLIILERKDEELYAFYQQALRLFRQQGIKKYKSLAMESPEKKQYALLAQQEYEEACNKAGEGKGIHFSGI